MPKPRSQKREDARQIYNQHSGKITLAAIAKQLGVSDAQVRKWKSADEWERNQSNRNQSNRNHSNRNHSNRNHSNRNHSNRNQSKPKSVTIQTAEGKHTEGNPKINSGGAPRANKNALKHGGYETIHPAETSAAPHIAQALVAARNGDAMAAQMLLLAIALEREAKMSRRIAAIEQKPLTIDTISKEAGTTTYKRGGSAGAKEARKHTTTQVKSSLETAQNMEARRSENLRIAQAAINQIHKMSQTEGSTDALALAGLRGMFEVIRAESGAIIDATADNLPTLGAASPNPEAGPAEAGPQSQGAPDVS